jgi:subtilisin family serine protease
MTVEDQERVKREGYALAKRYMDNAKDMLKKAGRDGRRYKDPKYVSSASGIAYKGILVALDCWLRLKEVEMPENKDGKENRRQIGFYRSNLKDLDKKLLNDLNDAYDDLHLFGYYDCNLNVSVIDEGFKIANDILARIKPEAAL